MDSVNYTRLYCTSCGSETAKPSGPRHNQECPGRIRKTINLPVPGLDPIDTVDTDKPSLLLHYEDRERAMNDRRDAIIASLESPEVGGHSTTETPADVQFDCGKPGCNGGACRRPQCQTTSGLLDSPTLQALAKEELPEEEETTRTIALAREHGTQEELEDTLEIYADLTRERLQPQRQVGPATHVSVQTDDNFNVVGFDREPLPTPKPPCAVCHKYHDSYAPCPNQKGKQDFDGTIDGAGYKGSMDDPSKPPISLVTRTFIWAVARVLGIGAVKYARGNWMRGMSFTETINGVMRHVTAWSSGETYDPETGQNHLAHAACGLMFLLTFQEGPRHLEYRKFDDRIDEHPPYDYADEGL